MSQVARGLAIVKSFTPVLDTAIYAANDVLFQPTELVSAMGSGGGCAILESLIIHDLANQKQKIDLLFFSKNPANSIGANNAAYALVDADAQFLLGRISILDTDFISSGTNNAEATVKAIGLLLTAETTKPGSGVDANKSIWIAGICRSGTPTYAASDIVMRIGLLQE